MAGKDDPRWMHWPIWTDAYWDRWPLIGAVMKFVLSQVGHFLYMRDRAKQRKGRR